MIYVLLFILTLIFSAFFSGSETAFIAANRLKLRISQHGSENGQSSMPDLLQSDQRFITSTLVGNNIMMVACSSLSVVVFSSFVSSTMLVVFTSAFLLLIGEIVPKSIAAQIPNRLVMFSLKVLTLFSILFFPLIWLTEALTRLIVQSFRGDLDQAHFFTKYDLPVLVREYTSTQQFDVHDELLLHRSLKFLEKRLWDVMIPRTDVVGVDQADPVEEVVEKFKNSGFSRIAVYQDNLDQIKGFYYFLDFFGEKIDLASLLRPALVLPESMNAMEALRTFQKAKVSIAVSVDEHGGTAGLVTVEDIVEMLVGAIDDEFDMDRFHIRKVGEAAIVSDGRATIDELRDRLDIPLPEGEYVTIAGLVQEKLGRIATAGEIVELPNCRIKVLEATATTITKVLIVNKSEKSNRDRTNLTTTEEEKLE